MFGESAVVIGSGNGIYGWKEETFCFLALYNMHRFSVVLVLTSHGKPCHAQALADNG